MTDTSLSTSIGCEFVDVGLGDRRLNRRCLQIVEALSRCPEKGFPQAIDSDSALEATYRFLNNARVESEDLLAPHRQETRRRAQAAHVVRVLHDTTTLSFSGEKHRDGMGYVSRKQQGFFAHVALVTTADALREPLGIGGMIPVVRENPTDPRPWRERMKDPNREFARWENLFRRTHELLDGVRAIHVMDREADSYALIHAIQSCSSHFVIRLKYDRALVDSEDTVRSALATVDDVLKREVPLTRRTNKGRSTQEQQAHPARDARIAKLRARATTVTVRRPLDLKNTDLPPTMQLHVVQVHEVDEPEGIEPVEWTLITNEPIETTEHVAAVVDHYRARWMIEELFKALKTGCAFEKRQLESQASLENALALFLPIAWRLLLLRHMAQHRPDEPAERALTKTQIRLLRLKSKRVKLGPTPTVRDCMLAIAGLGGHLKRNGDPGWQTLGRGLDDLLLLEQGFLLAQSEM